MARVDLKDNESISLNVLQIIQTVSRLPGDENDACAAAYEDRREENRGLLLVDGRAKLKERHLFKFKRKLTLTNWYS